MPVQIKFFNKYLSARGVLLCFRLLIGSFFVAVAVDKILEPHENFLYVIQGYSVFPEWLEEFVSWVFPWVEFYLGLFIFLGLWLKWNLRGLLLILTAFILIIIQALLRKLPIEFCGCFGGLFSSKLHDTLILDFTLWILTYAMLRRREETQFLSLDYYFSKKNTK